MLKKIIPFITAMALLVTMFTIPASAFKPVVEENDIGWFLGYDPSTKHVVIDSHNDGIKVTFNYLGKGQYWSDRVTLGRYYDLTDTDAFIKKVDEIIGLHYVEVIHINDSKNILGAHKDRHENIGYGFIGFETLYRFANHQAFKDSLVICKAI